MATTAPGARDGDVLALILSILLPPVGVLLTRGLGGQFVINILLTLFGYVPGLIHAVWLAARS